MSSSKTTTASAAKKPAAQKTAKKPAAPAASSSASTSTPSKAPAKVVKKKAAAPAKAEKSEETTTSAPETSTTEESTATPSAEETTDGETPAAEGGASEQVSLEKQIDDMISRKEEDRKKLRNEIAELRTWKRVYLRQLRDMRKHKKRRDVRVGGAPRNPSGFAQSSRIRDDLCDFLKLERGSSIARTDVTKMVIAYIKEHNLEKGGNRRNIEPDEALTRLVGDADERRKTMERRKEIKPKTVVTDELSYFNLQVHLNKHFINEAEEKRRAAAEAEQSAQASVSA